jgi:hypothetical protein
VSWTRMGEGNVDIEGYIRDFLRKCPGRPLSLEVIVTGPRLFNYLDTSFWEPYKKTPAWEFAQFLSLADKGSPRAAPAQLPKDQAAARELQDVEASVRWTLAFLSKL